MRNLTRALIATLTLAILPIVSQAGVFIGVSVGIAPPALPVYVQPPCPEPGYIWIPGYWAWDDGYYWVPGTWALSPSIGLLWTPGYWGWTDGAYFWHEGYWGRHVGFYGGINYGFGYGGVGYQGGYWRGHEFYYNRAVTNVSTTNITNVYNRTVVNNVTINRVSFNGGAGGVVARPTAAQMAAANERHSGLTPVQRQQVQLARGNSSLRAAVNGGRPAIAATARPAVFSGHGVVAARGAEGSRGAPPTALNHADRPPQAQRPPMANHAAGTQAERPTMSPAHPGNQHPNAARPATTHPQASVPRAPANYAPAARGGYPSAPGGAHENAPRAPQAYPQGAAPGRAPQVQARAEPQGGGHERPGSERPERGH